MFKIFWRIELAQTSAVFGLSFQTASTPGVENQWKWNCAFSPLCLQTFLRPFCFCAFVDISHGSHMLHPALYHFPQQDLTVMPLSEVVFLSLYPSFIHVLKSMEHVCWEIAGLQAQEDLSQFSFGRGKGECKSGPRHTSAKTSEAILRSMPFLGKGRD